MSLHSMRAADYLLHMIEAIDRIQTYTKDKSEDAFESDNLLQDAVLRNLGVLGEAAKNFLAVAHEQSNTGILRLIWELCGMWWCGKCPCFGLNWKQFSRISLPERTTDPNQSNPLSIGVLLNSGYFRIRSFISWKIPVLRYAQLFENKECIKWHSNCY